MDPATGFLIAYAAATAIVLSFLLLRSKRRERDDIEPFDE